MKDSYYSSGQFLFALIFLIIFPCLLSAQSVTWTAGGDSTSWDDPANWSTGTVPDSESEVVIDLNTDDPFTIRISQNRTVESIDLTSRNASLDLSANLNVTSDYYQNFSTLTGSGDLIVDGDLFFDNGLMSGTGSSIANGGGQFDSGVLDMRRFVVSSGQTLRKTNSFDGKNGAVLEIESNATFQNENYRNMSVTSDSDSLPRIVNHGLITTTLENESAINWRVENHGVIRADAGNHIQLSGEIADMGGTYRAEDESARLDLLPAGNVDFNESSEISATEGALIQMSHSSDSDTPPSITISGMLNVGGSLKLGESYPPVDITMTESADVQNAGGEALTVGDRASVAFETSEPVSTGELSLNFEGELSLNSALNVSESLNLNNASSVFRSDEPTTVVDVMNWQGGTITGSGSITAAGGMELTGGPGSSSNVKQLETHQIIVPDGALATYSGALLNGANGASMIIRPGGEMLISENGDFSVSSGSSTSPVVENRGIIRKGGGTHNTELDWRFENHGQLISESGRFMVRGTIADSNGVYRASQGGHLDFIVSEEQTDFGPESSIEETGGEGQIRFESQSSDHENPIGYNVNGDFKVNGRTIIEGTGQSTELVITDQADSVSIGNLTVNFRALFRTNTALTIEKSLRLDNTSAGFENNDSVRVAGSMNWRGGTISGTGTTVADAGMELPGGAGSASNVKKLDGHELILAEEDTAKYTGNLLRAEDGAVLRIEEGAVFDFQNWGNMEVSSENAPAPRIINRGTFIKSSGDSDSEVGWNLENYGVVQSANDRLRFYGSITDQNGHYSATTGGRLMFRPALKVVTFKENSLFSSDTTGTISFGRQGGAEPRDTSLVYHIHGTMDMSGTTRLAGTGEADVTVTADATLKQLAGTALEMDDNSGVLRSEHDDSLVVGSISMGRNNQLYLQSPLDVTGDVFQDDSNIQTSHSIDIRGEYEWSGGDLVGPDTLTAHGGMQMTDGGVLDSLHIDVPGGQTAVINTRGFGGNSLYGKNGATLEVAETARLEIEGWNDIRLASGSSAPPAIINRGILTNTGGYNMAIVWPFENYGVVDVQNGRIGFTGPITDHGSEFMTSGANLDFFSDADILLSDQTLIDIDSDGRVGISDEGQFRTGGDIVVNGELYTESPVRSEGRVTLNDPGTIIHGRPGRISNDPDSVIHLVDGGRLEGTGFITGDVVSDSGSVHPGGVNSTGVLNVQGRFVQRDSSLVDLELGGDSPGEGYDRLEAESVEIEGRLKLSLINGYSPGSNVVLEPFRWTDEISGRFASIDYSDTGDMVLGTRYDSNSLRIFDGSLPEPPSAPAISIKTSAPFFARTGRGTPVNVEISTSSNVAIGKLETDNIAFGRSSPPNVCPTDDAYENLKCRMAPFDVVPPEPSGDEQYPFLVNISAQEVLSQTGSSGKRTGDMMSNMMSGEDEQRNAFNDHISKLTTSRAAFIRSDGLILRGSASCSGAGQNLQTSVNMPGPIMTNESLDRCAAEAATKVLKDIGSAIIPGFECYSLYSDISGQFASGFKNNHDMAAGIVSNVLGALDCAGDFVPATKAIKIMQDLNSQIRTANDFKTCFAQNGGGGASGGAQITCVGAIDPNEKLGPQGVGSERYTARQDSLPYTVFFENKAEATAPAQQVVVYDTLDTSAHATDSFTFGAVAFGDTSITTPNDTVAFEKEVDLRPDRDLLLNIEGDVESQTGLITWTFTSLDPETGEPTTDPLAGFLPPNEEAPEGEGSLSYFVDIKDNAVSGTHAGSAARIIFDQNDPIDTSVWSNILDYDAPQSSVNSLEGTQDSTGFSVSWSGSDAESGIQSYSIFVSKDGAAFSPWIEDTTATSAVFTGEKGSEYRFYSTATDSVGLDEQAPSNPDAATFISGDATSTGPGDKELPQQFTLEQNYPNPFNPTTTIRFGLPEASDVSLKIYNTMGREVAVLIENQNRTAGWYDATFDASNLSSGVYIYRLRTDSRSESRKLTLIK